MPCHAIIGVKGSVSLISKRFLMPRPPVDISSAGVLYRHIVYSSTSSVSNSWTVVSQRYREVTEGVKRKKPSGWLPPTAYRLEMRHYSYPKGTCQWWRYTSPYDGSRYDGLVGSGPNARFNALDHWNGAYPESNMFSASGTALRNAALIAVRNKLKNSDVNLGVAFGERKQTARLLGDTATRIAKSIRDLKRGKIRSAMDHLGISSRKREPRGSNVPSKWLEMQYGWKPLLGEVYGAADALSRHPKDHWRVTAKATRSEVDSYVKEYDLFDASTSRAEVKSSVFARIDVLPQNEAKISLASLGVTNPLLVGWELVPFSFVVDWFLPIGGYLESLDAMLGYSQEGSYYSSTLRREGKWIDTGKIVHQVSGGSVYNNFVGTKRCLLVSRQVSEGVPLPQLPRFKDPRSLGHMANGLALLAQVFGRR